MRGDGGSILSRESYTYEFDRFGNWTKMVTNLVVFESGELTREPIEVTYRSLTYYFDESIARIANAPSSQTLAALPSASNFRLSKFEGRLLQLGTRELPSPLPVTVGEPPPQLTTPTGSDAASEPVATVRNAAPENPEPSQKEAEAFQLFKTVRDLYDVGNVKGAVEAYLKYIELEPTSAEVHLSLGQAYLILKKDKDALRAFRDCLRLNPNVAEAHYGMGLSSFRMGHHQDAAIAFKQATLLSPKLAKAHYGLALSYQEIGNQSGVIDEYRILQTLDSSLAKQLSRTFPDFDLPCRVPPYCK
jgi:tetratricopeptide (TPR) repeat protein